MDDIVVYTCIIGNYDKLPPPEFPDVARYICFSDTNQPRPGWEVVMCEPSSSNARIASRKPKILAHEFVTAKVSIYHDGNRCLLLHPDEVMKRWLVNADLALFGHPHRQTVQEEADVCVKWGLANIGMAAKQLVRYERAGFDNNGPHLRSGGILVRHHCNTITGFNELWWDEYTKGCQRDQLSLAYTLWEWDKYYTIIPGDYFANRYFHWQPHGGLK